MEGRSIIAYEKMTYWLLFTCASAFVVIAFAVFGFMPSIRGFLAVQTCHGRLISDFTVLGGIGGALFNSGLMGFLAILLVRISGVKMSGPTVAATLTIMGFSLFGKTPLNAFPIVTGVFLASVVAGKPFRSYLLMAMFGTAIGPLVSFVVFESGLRGFLAFAAGMGGGITVGFILPAIAIAMLRMHEGFNLYNIGLTSGFLGLFIASIIAGAGHGIEISIIWNTDRVPALLLLVPGLSFLFIAWGIALDRGKAFGNFCKIMRMSGRLPSDFMESVSPGAALVNSGVLGLAGSLYLFVIGADMNGPVIGGLLTVMGFATFGKHPRNCLPVVIGVVGATFFFGKSLTAPGPVLAFLFATTLAPLAGEFGPVVGFAAGFMHLLVVERSAAWHGGLDLYNNGFAGGLTATLFVAIIQWFRSMKNK